MEEHVTHLAPPGPSGDSSRLSALLLLIAFAFDPLIYLIGWTVASHQPARAPAATLGSITA